MFWFDINWKLPLSVKTLYNGAGYIIVLKTYEFASIIDPDILPDVKSLVDRCNLMIGSNEALKYRKPYCELDVKLRYVKLSMSFDYIYRFELIKPVLVPYKNSLWPDVRLF